MISFVETKLFTRLVQEYLSDDEYSSFSKPCLIIPSQAWSSHALAVSVNYAGAWLGAANAEASESSISSVCGKGRSGLLTLYPKNVAENIPAHVLKQIKDEIDG